MLLGQYISYINCNFEKARLTELAEKV